MSTMTNSVDEAFDADLATALKMSLMEMRGETVEPSDKSPPTLEQAVNEGMPDTGRMSFAEQLRLAKERSMEDMAKEQQEMERIQQTSRDPLQQSHKDPEDYAIAFQNCLSDLRGSNSNSTTPQEKKKNKKKGQPLPLDSVAFSTSGSAGIKFKTTREEEEEAMLRKALGRSANDFCLKQSTVENCPAMELPVAIPSTSGSTNGLEEKEIMLALDVSSQDFTEEKTKWPQLPEVQVVYEAASAKSAVAAARPVLVNPDGPRRRRPIVLDGCNVAFAHGRNDAFSAKGLEIVYKYFWKKGWRNEEIVIFVKPCGMSPRDREICDMLDKLGILHWTPCRVAGNSYFVSDDDVIILDYAADKDGVVMTRDYYRDSYDRYPKYRKVIKKRLLQFNFVNDELILPPDPLGKGGPDLDSFLRF